MNDSCIITNYLIENSLDNLKKVINYNLKKKGYYILNLDYLNLVSSFKLFCCCSVVNVLTLNAGSFEWTESRQDLK